jgi:chromosome partitioning protein
MSKHIAIAASKGGTGKTTTTWNLGFGLSLAGARVLLVDCDPQDNLRFIADLEESRQTLAAAIENGKVEPTPIRETISLVPSGGRKLAQVAFDAENFRSVAAPLKRALGALDDDFDFILFDCPPEFGRMTSVALSQANYLLVPCMATWLGLRSIEQMVDFIDTHARDAHIVGDRTGIVLTFYTTRKSGPELVRQEAKQIFKGRLLKTLIRERAEMDYSQEAHKSVFEHAPSSNAAEDYGALVKEVIKRMG